MRKRKKLIKDRRSGKMRSKKENEELNKRIKQ